MRGRPLTERFWEKVDVGGPDECWDWQGARAHYGHGIINVTGRSLLAHRVAWSITHGDPAEANVCHRCDNPPCCNPAHLFLGSQADNIADMHRKGRYVKRGRKVEA